MKRILTILITISFFWCNAQYYAEEKFYLVDSLDFELITAKDKILIDSCLQIFHSNKHDTIRVKALNFIVETTWDEKIWPKYNFWLSKWLSQKIKIEQEPKAKNVYETLYAGSLINSGYYYRLIGDIKLALDFYQKSYSAYEKLNEKQGLAYCLNNMGVIYDSYGDIPRALESYQKSLTIQEEINDKEGIANSLNNIGAIYKSQGEEEKALEYYNKCLSIQQKIGNKRGEAMILLKIGDIFRIQEHYEETEKYFNKSLELSIEIENKSAKASALRELGNLFMQIDDDTKSLEYYNSSIKLYEDINDVEEIIKGYNNIATLFFKLKQLKNAQKYADNAMELAKKIGYTEAIASTAKLLSQIYELENNKGKALEMYKLHIVMRDSIRNDKNEKLAIRNQMQYEFEQKKNLLKIEQEKQIAIANEEKKRHQAINIAFAIGILLVSVFLVIIINRLKITNKQKKIISITNKELNNRNEELAAQRDKIEQQKDEIIIQKKVLEVKNNEILGSITYAKRIQESILPSESLVKGLLPDSFIIYKPKDIVAGDFYWIQKHKNLVIFAVADCTGHGVPGAMVSVICHTALNRVVREDNLTEPALILDKTREIIAERFQNSNNDVQDGMDISICVWDKENNKISYAGANSSIYIIRKNSTEIEIIKGDKQPVGYYQNATPFTQTIINVNLGDLLYLFSDGYADQFGGNNNKKMGYQQFRDLILKNHHLSLENQCNLLNQEFESWKGN
jgi:tetratricopeptide (TPR) repeat protein